MLALSVGRFEPTSVCGLLFLLNLKSFYRIRINIRLRLSRRSCLGPFIALFVARHLRSADLRGDRDNRGIRLVLYCFHHQRLPGTGRGVTGLRLSPLRSLVHPIMLPRVVYASPRNYRPLTSGVIMGAPEWMHQDQEISPNFAAPVQVQSSPLEKPFHSPPRLKPSEATRMTCKGINRSGAACSATSFNQTVRRETLWVQRRSVRFRAHLTLPELAAAKLLMSRGTV